jgi:xanthine dehydrogenase YagS FAD-binding subunit
MLRTFDYVRAGSLDEAVKQLGTPGTRAHAGGTDLLGCLRDGVMKVDKVVSLSRLDDLRGIAATTDGGLRIGALATIAEIAMHPVVAEKYAALAQAAAAVASPQLRNQGTLGGNLCQRPRCWYFRGDFPCARKGGDVCFAMNGQNQYHAIFGGSLCYIVHPSDTAPALVALDASVRIAGAKGSRVMPLEKFFVLPDVQLTRENVLEPGEIVTEVLLPKVETPIKSAYRKVRARGSWDFALAGIALAVTMRGDKVGTARIVLSGVAPVPWRLAGVERVLVGEKLDAKTIAKAATAAVTGAQPLEHNGYKVALVRGLVEDALEKIAA